MQPRARGALIARTIVTALAACALFAPDAFPQVSRPSASRRIVKHWDFEDREVHGLDLPQHWSRHQTIAEHREPDGTVIPGIEREGFPPWNRAAYTDADARSGKWSMALPTRGGSTSLVFNPAALPVIPLADYEVSCHIRTDRIVHARARFIVTMLDEHAVPIPGAVYTSEPIVSPNEWTEVRTIVRGRLRAASMQIELQLIQPKTLAGSLSDLAPNGRAWPEDIEGAALFDDLQVAQRPRIHLTTSSPGNIIADGRAPTLQLFARDTTGDALTAFLEVHDIRGRLVDRVTRSIQPTWTPVLWMPNIERYGWYEMSARVVGPDGDVGATTSAFAWTEPAREGISDSPFGIVLSDLAPAWSPLTPSLVRASGASHASIPIQWGIDGHDEELLALTDRILDDGVSVSMTIDDADDPTKGLFAALNDPSNPDNAKRINRLLPLLTRFGERVRQWEIGDTPLPGLSARESDAITRSALDLLRRYVPRPVVALPWDMHNRPPSWPSDQRTLTPRLPAWTHSSASAEYVHAWRDATMHEDVPIVLETVDAGRAGLAWAAVDLAHRAILAWSAGAAPIQIEQPWILVGEGDSIEPVVAPHLAVWRALATRLDGVAYAGEYPAPPGVAAVFGRRADSGTLILWSSRPDRDAFVANLGASTLTAFDLFGNPVPIEHTSQGVRIPMTTAPVFVEGIDPELATFLAGLAIEPATFSVAATRQSAELVVSNPWITSASIRVRFEGPEQWEALPRVSRATVRPGESQRLPISLQIGLGEIAGHRAVELEIAITADREYPPFKVTLPIELGMEGIHALPLYHINARGDLVLELLITNRSAAPVGLDLIARAPGRPTTESPITALAPTQSMLRSFVFPDAASLIGADARISLRKRGSTERLNIGVPIR